jgi:hypothetical protein
VKNDVLRVACRQDAGAPSSTGFQPVSLKRGTGSRGADFLWLVFDDMLGGSLKSENHSMNLQAVAVQLNASLPQ